jgi:hypothetical protein
MTNKMKKRIAAIGVATMVSLGFGVGAANAFYTSGGCGTSVGYLNVSNYSKGSGQEYHWSTHPKSSYWSFNKLYFAGSFVSKGSGVREGYIYRSNPTASYTTTVQFFAADPDGGMIQCSYVS